MELRSRSRSKTPFQTESFIQQESNHVTRSTTRKSVRSATTIGEEYKIESVKRPKKLTRSVIKTSDYSSEEEGQTHLTENERNQIVEDAIRAANGSSEISALNLYRKAGRYWDKYPKTDYTYSRHSRDRVELAPGVVQMPNMSRRTIHSTDSSTNTDSYLKTTSHLIKKRLFSSPNNNDQVDSSFKIHRSESHSTITKIISTVFFGIFTFAYWCFYSVYSTTHSATIFLGKKLHHLVSRVMLWDTWLLKKNHARDKSKTVVVLCLLPLLLLAAWFVLSSLGSAIYWYLTPSTLVPLPQTAITSDEIIEKLLQHPQFKQKESDEPLHEKIQELRAQIAAMRAEMSSRDRTIAHEFDRIGGELQRCCHQLDLEPHITSLFTKLLNNPDFLADQSGFAKFLHGLFVAKADLEGRLSNLTVGVDNETAGRVMEEVVARMSSADPISDQQIKGIVQAALRVYDADRTGLVDYAMEPLGGEVVTTRCTEQYHSGTAVISVLGVPIWYPHASPRVVITPGINPGECWAFQNFPGFLVVKLATKVKIEAFSVEHVSRLLVPEGKIDSAPKEFEVFGLQSENDKDPIRIGEYLYDYDGEALQFFTAQKEGLVFDLIEVRVKSNHGNPNYTCLYRFRVHGKVHRV